MTTLALARAERGAKEGAQPVSLADLKTMPAPQLAAQWASACAALEAAQARHELVHAALTERYWRKAERILRGTGRSCGTVHVIDQGLDVAIEAPGRDRVDQARMEKAIAKVEKLAVNWRDFVKVEYSIRRSALKALPDKVAALFIGTLETRVGKLRFTITQAKPLAAERAAAKAA